MWTELSSGIAELNADDDKTGAGQVLAQPRVNGIGGAGDGHAATVQMHNGGQRTIGIGAADVQRYVVSVFAGDRRRSRRHTVRVRNARRE